MAIIKVSQSLLKDLWKYQEDGLCGLVFRQRWLDPDVKKRRAASPTSEAMRLGQYFEYMATGQLNYWGEKPEPDRVRVTKKLQARIDRAIDWVESRGGSRFAKWLRALSEYEEWHSIATPYQRAFEQAQLFKDYLKEYRWKIVSTGEFLETPTGETAFIDVKIQVLPGGYWPWQKVGPWTPDARPRLDLKCSGLIGSKWGEMAWTIGNLAESRHHQVQATQYIHVTGQPYFAFFVFGTGTAQKAELFPVQVKQPAIELHLEEIRTARMMIRHNERTGWAPKPEFQRCKTCPLREGCAHKMTAPQSQPLTVIT